MGYASAKEYKGQIQIEIENDKSCAEVLIDLDTAIELLEQLKWLTYQDVENNGELPAPEAEIGGLVSDADSSGVEYHHPSPVSGEPGQVDSLG